MRYPRLFILLTVLSGASVLPGQSILNPNPSRVLGHPRLELRTGNPNFVEGRELFTPQGVAVDTGASPPILYVADTGNHRIMVWKNASAFAPGAPADLIIGQKDPYSTLAQGPATTVSTGLNSPTGLAVRNHDLYVVDSGNNRILRFPDPTNQTDILPDLVIGQPNFNSRTANQGGSPTANTLNLASGSNVFRASLAFDASGDLWVADAGNHRVLRYSAADLASGAQNPAANLVIGQVDFETLAPALPVTAEGQRERSRLRHPSGLAFDGGGRLFVSDGLSRALVFAPPFSNGMPARRIMGIYSATPTGQPDYRIAMQVPEGIFMAPGDCPAIIDALSSRILIFEPYDRWPEEVTSFSPSARSVVGQGGDFSQHKPNRGAPEPAAGTFSGPVAGVVAGGELYLADAGNHRVLVLPWQGVDFGPAVRVAGQPAFHLSGANFVESRGFQFRDASFADAGMAVDTRSDPPHLYVADTYNHRVLGYRDLRSLSTGAPADLVIGQPDMFRAHCNYPHNDPNRPNQSGLCSPTGLAVDDEGNLWVADSGNGRVLRFRRPFEHPDPLPKADLVIGQTSFTSKITDPTARTMASPYGLAFAGNDGLLVSDQVHNRVLFFPSTGGYTSGMAATKVFGQPDFTSALLASSQEPEDNRMGNPHHIAVDTDARIYVTDTRFNRVLVFDQVLNNEPTNARAVLTLKSIASPRGIYVSPETGEIWVADTNNGRILRYPRFDHLFFAGFQPDGVIPAGSASLAVTQDHYGNLYVADGSSRVAVHYPAMLAVNGAHFLPGRALAPGMVAALFPLSTPFGSETVAYTDLPNPLPMPTELGNLQVKVDGVPAPLFFVSPGQINIFVPTSAPQSGVAEFEVVETTTGRVLASAPVQMNVASPGLFTAHANGTGQVLAFNQDGTPNSPTNPAARGEYITLYGTGQGVVPGAPPDGEAPQAPIPTPDLPRVIIGACFVDDCGEDSEPVQYSGLAPGLIGVWQIKVRIPKQTAPSSEQPVAVAVLFRNIPSTGGEPQFVATTISVKK